MSRTQRIARTAALGAVVLAVLALVVPARADDPIPPILPTGSPSPTPTAEPSRQPRPPSKPKPRPTPRPTAPTPPAQPKGPAPDVYTGPIANALAYWESRPKSPSRTTTTLLDLLAKVQPPGVPLDEAAIVRGVGRFPIAGYVWYMDDWAAPRYLPYFHMHEGTDLFASSGTTVVAVANGTIDKLMVGTIGGVSIWLRGDDGTVYYYGHLRDYAPGLAKGIRVKAGTPIATVGNTGTAVTTPPHVHFEVHPRGGDAVNPKPFLDAWLDEAEAKARAAIARNVALHSAAKIGAARWRSVIGLLREPPAPPVSYWTAAVAEGDGGAAQLALDRIALEIDWAAVAERALAAHDGHDHSETLTPAAVDDGILSGASRGAGTAARERV